MTTDGTALTARFFEACGREYPPRGLSMRWQRPRGGPRVPDTPLPPTDYTQPGHLEAVIAMVRERWPEAIMALSHGWGKQWEFRMYHDNDHEHAGVRGIAHDENPATALMLAAIRAAGRTFEEAWQEFANAELDDKVGVLVPPSGFNRTHRENVAAQVVQFSFEHGYEAGAASARGEGWVSVEERLPRPMRTVLALTERHEQMSAYVTEGRRWRWSINHADAERHELITHWRPRLDPPTP